MAPVMGTPKDMGMLFLSQVMANIFPGWYYVSSFKLRGSVEAERPWNRHGKCDICLRSRNVSLKNTQGMIPLPLNDEDLKALPMMTQKETKQEYTEEDRKEEDRRIRHLRRLVDFSMALIAQSNVTREEAQRLVEAVRQQACQLFPGKEETFELIYTPRFRRLISEKFGLQ
jgi:hypothetical protein